MQFTTPVQSRHVNTAAGPREEEEEEEENALRQTVEEMSERASRWNKNTGEKLQLRKGVEK